VFFVGFLFKSGQVSDILGEYMKPVPIPRFLFFGIFVLIVVTFLAGTMRTVNSVHAAGFAKVYNPTPTLGGPTEEPYLTPTSDPLIGSVSGDTSGIIVLGILILAIVVIGTTLAGKRARPKIPS
jgi:hypothetical protein